MGKVNIVDFLVISENEDYSPYLHELNKNKLESGFIKWNDYEACCWGGPFPGNLVYYSIMDGRLTGWPLPDNCTHPDVMSKMSPIKIHLCGNDDTSYTLLLSNINLVSDILNNIINNPTFENIVDLGFRFSN